MVLSYIGFAFPFLMSLASAQRHLSPPTLLLLLLGVAVIAAAWLAIVAIRQRPAGSREPVPPLA